MPLDMKELIAFCERTADRLVMQYGEYAFLDRKIKELESEKFKMIAEAAKNRRISVLDAMKEEEAAGRLAPADERIKLCKADLQRISDEMTYPNPVVWMMYKDKAYKGTSSEIATLGDFRRHCEPQGYICTLRFAFLCAYLSKYGKTDLHDRTAYPDATKLSDIYSSEAVTGLLEDDVFLAQWKEREYLITDNKINKWDANSRLPAKNPR